MAAEAAAANGAAAAPAQTVMVGDTMETDILGGVQLGFRTVLVLTGISDRSEIERYPFRPNEVLDSVADLIERDPVESEG